MRRKLTQRGKDRRRQLMEHAAELFAERGYHPTSVSDIVESLRVGKGVFYWYFSSKEELLAEILRESHQDLRRRQQQAIGDEPNPVLRAAAPFFAAALLAELSFAILGSSLKAIDTHGAHLSPGFGSPSQIGQLFLTRFLIAFEVVSLLLLIAAVGAIVLARRSSLSEPDRRLDADRRVF